MSIQAHAAHYKPNAYQEYTIEELSWWVKLLCKRSTHRKDDDKQQKDLYDAANYLEMLYKVALVDGDAVPVYQDLKDILEAAKRDVTIR